VIAGATKPEQVKANAGAAAWRMSLTEVAEVTELAR
jgi:aryl-alcohol dehydrogenase-like predicted oxidoreductase